MMRLIYSSEIVRDTANCEIAYVVRGKSFLRYMVRKIVGTILDAGKGKIAAADIARIFEARDRTLSGPTVQPQGLYLVSLEYPDPANSWATFKAQRPKKA
jgi:tRNA pseudouridine38-40 synthase